MKSRPEIDVEMSNYIDIEYNSDRLLSPSKDQLRSRIKDEVAPRLVAASATLGYDRSPALLGRINQLLSELVDTVTNSNWTWLTENVDEWRKDLTSGESFDDGWELYLPSVASLVAWLPEELGEDTLVKAWQDEFAPGVQDELGRNLKMNDYTVMQLFYQQHGDNSWGASTGEVAAFIQEQSAIA